MSTRSFTTPSTILTVIEGLGMRLVTKLMRYEHFLFWQDSVYVCRLERLSDAVVKLESFAGSDKEQNPLFREYHGNIPNSVADLERVMRPGYILMCLQVCFIWRSCRG